MPYVKPEFRQMVDGPLEELIERINQQFGEQGKDGIVNYCISRTVAGTIGLNGWRYFRIARGIAAFICAALEFYRRIAVPYEDQAIKDNGDIPEYAKPR